ARHRWRFSMSGREGGRMERRGQFAGEYISPYLQRSMRGYEEVRQKQISRRVLDEVILETLTEAKSAGHGPVGPIDLATHAALKARPDMSALDALEAVERIRRRSLL
ncbi:MAG: hypothetical protein V3V34_08285, partial [Kiloniellales bacterium]